MFTVTFYIILLASLYLTQMQTICVTNDHIILCSTGVAYHIDVYHVQRAYHIRGAYHVGRGTDLGVQVNHDASLQEDIRRQPCKSETQHRKTVGSQIRLSLAVGYFSFREHLHPQKLFI